MEAKFILGQLVVTRGVADLMHGSSEFSNFVQASFQRYISADWGEMHESDKAQNDHAMAHNDDRIFAAYTNEKNPEWKLWIITEWDHSATTLLFPSEY